MTIYLIRHGQKDLHAGDPGLTEAGVRQARETGLFLQQFPITKIVASPLKRTTQTAALIAEALERDYSTDWALAERMNWSDDLSSRDDFLREWVKATNDRDYVPKTGDSSRRTGDRVGQLIEKLKQKDAQFALVTHGGAILDYLRNLFGDDKLSALRQQYEFGQDFQMLHCAVNQVELSDEPLIRLLNYVDHLSEVSE
jgi:broad specificity phosphatase PhoE